MGRRIQVNPAELSRASAQIQAQAAEYRKLYNMLYGDVGAMKAAWQGKDNLAFTTQIEGFREDFEQMAKLMDQYAQFLKSAAQTYQQAQDDVTAAARRLRS
jgi:WXG100 family type VII secretion target